MDCSLSLVFPKFALLASDAVDRRSILVMKEDQNKAFKLSDKLLMSVTGDTGDAAQFAEFIAKNVQLYKIRNSYELSPAAATHFTRRNLADYLRSRTPFQVNLIIAGYDDEKECCEMYLMDYLAAVVKVPYAAHGYGGFFSTAIMDRDYREDMTPTEAYGLLQDCVKEIQKRLVINLPSFQVQQVDKDGIKRLDDINVKNLP